MFAVRGIVNGNTVEVGEKLSEYQGMEAIVTILDFSAEERKPKDRTPGIAKGKFVCPDDMDEENELIAKWFEESE